ncbi:glycosyltransferase family 4 protein [Plastoroseomonas arctica]|uniref:Glycosyltransferase family 4 protein n=1 Tax=Plastoroseomonas arctica TaxID=1509237 RepID=A0AAF1KR76_9PROT|nr:glycosyltransferase family 4 protein [Plastoroseomonas arctica]MBR0653982.1 glycosyltransferase family 4 protein [Plastoroseomonas arctica]
MKVIEVANVDFALRHFVLPLMCGARARGHEVIGVCAEGPLLDTARADGFRIVTPPMARSLSPVAQWRAYRALLSLFRAERPDMVHAHMPISGFLARMAAWRAGVPRIAYTCHGFLFNQPGPWWRRGLSFGLEWLAGRVTDRFLTVSAEEAADARRLHIHAGAEAVLNGRDPAVFRPDPAARAALRAELGAADGDCVVIAVSRLVRHKGYPELLRAMEAVPDATLWVVGERLPSDHGQSLDADFARAEAALGPRLKRLGYRHDVARLLAAADVFTLPSHFEGLPMSIIEAMLTGLPVVATDVRGPREQVVAEETGLLVPPAQDAPLAAALARLAADPALRARMGEAGRQRARALFDEAKVIGHTLDCLGL